MKINLKRQTTWGCVRHFKVYKNGSYQGKLFNNISTELEVTKGDILEFREGFFRFSQKIEVTDDTKEVTITTTKHIQQLFTLFILLFLVLSLLIFSIKSLALFLIAEVSIFLFLNFLFRYRSYQFSVETQRPFRSLLQSVSPIRLI